MDPIYNEYGYDVGWLNVNNIHCRYGAHIGVVKDINVYGLIGQYLGTFENKLFRDRQGDVVAFVRYCKGISPLPMRLIPQKYPPLKVPRIPKVFAKPPPYVSPTSKWGIKWSEFISP